MWDETSKMKRCFGCGCTSTILEHRSNFLSPAQVGRLLVFLWISREWQCLRCRALPELQTCLSHHFAAEAEPKALIEPKHHASSAVPSLGCPDSSCTGGPQCPASHPPHWFQQSPSPYPWVLPLLPFPRPCACTESVADHKLHNVNRDRRIHLRLCQCSWGSLPFAVQRPLAVPFSFAFALRHCHDRTIEHIDTVQVTASREFGALSLKVPQQRWHLRVRGSTGSVLQHRAHKDISISVPFWVWWLRRPAGPVLRHLRVPSVP